MNVVYYILSIMIFTVFDVIGYYYLLTKKETTEPLKTDLYFYRFLQISFQIGISVGLYFIDYRLTIAFLLSHWFGLCDLLYYWLCLRWITFDDMTWVQWTPYGFILWLLKKKIDYKYLIVFSLLSIIISIIIIK